MNRSSFAALSLIAVSCLSGCCCPNMWSPFGGGQCGVQPHGAAYGAGGPTAMYSYDGVQTAMPVMGQPIAMPMTTGYPTVALESLPTIR